MKNQFVKDLTAGKTVNDTFVLLEKAVSRTRDGKPYLTGVAADKTGQIKLIMWDNAEAGAEGIVSGDHVQINGRVDEYRGSPQLVAKILKRCDRREIDASDYLAAEPLEERDRLFQKLTQMTERMDSPHLKRLFQIFWEDAAFVEAFKTAPAAMRIHHALLGGLLKHTVSMAVLAERIVEHYKVRGGIDRDLLIAGVILHDIGKIKEFEYTWAITYSDEGRLLGHIVIGLRMLDEKLKQIEDFPLEQANLIRHMIASHHGTREFGSPELPKTLEAVLLNAIDEIDARVDGIRDFIAVQEGSENWSSFYSPLDRRFYLGQRKPEDA